MNDVAAQQDDLLPVCRQRGHRVANDRWLCQSDRLIIPGQVVEGAFCRSECPYVDHSESGTLLPPQNYGNAPHPEMAPASFLEQIRNSSESFPPGWQYWSVAQAVHRQLFQQAHASPSPPYPAQKSGRGIIIGAGGMLYFRCAWVCVSILRTLGCRLPIEFWYLGHGEMDEEMIRLVEPMGVKCRDALEVTPQPRILKGWQLKPFSLIHSSFREVLYLDADNLPVTDPTYLFDHPAYSTQGALFWPDLPPQIAANSKIHTVTWDLAAISWREGRAFETGQFLIDTNRCWAELNLCMHLNEHSDFWYRYVYGDKDTFKLAWHKKQTAYAMPDKEASWDHPSIWQYDPDGNTVFVHACRGKQNLMEGIPVANYPHNRLVTRAARRLSDSWSRLQSTVQNWNPFVSEIWELSQQQPCVHRGEQIGLQKNGSSSAELFACQIHARCTISEIPQTDVPSCVGCDDFLLKHSPGPSRNSQIKGLHPDRHYNGSIIRYRDQMLLAYRRGEIGSTIWIAGLSEKDQVLWSQQLELPSMRENRLGCEDPRLFVYQNRLHLSYSGVETRDGTWIVNMLYCRLDDDYQVEQHFPLRYEHRQNWEKNWQFFQHQQNLYCVYTIAPHVILKVRDEQASFYNQVNWPVLWKSGFLRGGAPPVRVGDEYYSFFHGMDNSTSPPTYTLGCYTFESAPPFRPTRTVQEPLLSPDLSDQPSPEIAHCVYPCGVVRRDDRWVISYGYYDHQVWLAEFPIDAVEDALIPIPRPMRGGDS